MTPPRVAGEAVGRRRPPRTAKPTRTKATNSPAWLAAIRRRMASGGRAAADAAADAAGAAADRKTVWPDRSPTNSGRPRPPEAASAVADFDGVLAGARAIAGRTRTGLAAGAAAACSLVQPEPSAGTGARPAAPTAEETARRPKGPRRGGVRPCARRSASCRARRPSRRPPSATAQPSRSQPPRRARPQPAAEPRADEAAPRKAGWWSRRFGSGE